MPAKIVNSADTEAYSSALNEVLGALRGGALVVFPTETVYGLAASAASPQGMKRLRQAKRVQDDRPFTVHLGRRGDARLYLREPSALFRRLARKGWPGPLTLVGEEPAPDQTEIARQCPPAQLAEIYQGGTVGLRWPDHPVAERLLADAGVPVVASSANTQGAPPPADLDAALRGLDDQVDYAIDGGRTRFNGPSTVVEVRGNDWSIRRPGVIDDRTIRRLARTEILFVCTGNSCRSPMAEYLFRHKLAQALGCRPDELEALGYAVASSGTFVPAGATATPGSRAEMARRGIDLAPHRGQPLTVELIQQAERIFVMSPEHRDAVLDLVPGAAARTELLDPAGPVADPLGGGEEDYRRCAERLDRLVEARVMELLNDDLNW